MRWLLILPVGTAFMAAALAQDQISDVTAQSVDERTLIHPRSTLILSKDGTREKWREVTYWDAFRRNLHGNLLVRAKALSDIAIENAIRRALQAIEPTKGSSYSGTEAPDNPDPGVRVNKQRGVPLLPGGRQPQVVDSHFTPTGKPIIEPRPTKENSSLFLFSLLAVFLVPAAAITSLALGVSHWKVGRRIQAGVFFLIGGAISFLIWSAVAQAQGGGVRTVATLDQEQGLVPVLLSRILQPFSTDPPIGVQNPSLGRPSARRP